MKILIVEDELVLASELQHVVQELGYDVVGVSASAEQASSIAANQQIDVALVDVHLKDGITGPKLADRLAAEKGARIVFTTSDPGRLPDGRDYVATVIHKPYTSFTIRRALQHISSEPRPDAPGVTPSRQSHVG